MLCGIPQADGMLADIGGGSLELVRLAGGRAGQAQTFPLGVIRLADRAAGDLMRARTLAEADLSGTPWISQSPGRDLYLVGGAWRALARIHMAQAGYPLAIVHHYTINDEQARELAGMIGSATRRTLEKLPGAPRRRVDDLPYAAVVLRRVLRATAAQRVVFSGNGIREGWYMGRIPPATAQQDPVLAASRDLGERHGRDPALPAALTAWTAPLFPHETADEARLREAACLMSDIGAHDHPEYRAEQAYLRVLRQPGVALDHHGRAFLALAVAVRYEADPAGAMVAVARQLMDGTATGRAVLLGHALRLAYVLSAGTPALLSGDGADGGRWLAAQLASRRRRVRGRWRDTTAGAAGAGDGG